jgi:hypothetical protein
MQAKRYPHTRAGQTLTDIAALDKDLHPPSPLGFRVDVLVWNPLVRRCIGRRMQIFESPPCSTHPSPDDPPNLGPRGFCCETGFSFSATGLAAADGDKNRLSRAAESIVTASRLKDLDGLRLDKIVEAMSKARTNCQKSHFSRRRRSGKSRVLSLHVLASLMMFWQKMHTCVRRAPLKILHPIQPNLRSTEHLKPLHCIFLRPAMVQASP